MSTCWSCASSSSIQSYSSCLWEQDVSEAILTVNLVDIKYFNQMNFKFCRYLINCKKHLLWILIFFISYFFDSCKFYEIITELQCSWFYINSHDLKLLTVESRNLCNTRKSLVNVLFSHLVDIFTPKSTTIKWLERNS